MGKTPEEIRAEIRTARDEFAGNVRGLSSEIHPSIIKARTVQQVKDGITDRAIAAKGLMVDDAGVRWDRIGTIVLCTASVLAVQGIVRRIIRALFS